MYNIISYFIIGNQKYIYSDTLANDFLSSSKIDWSLSFIKIVCTWAVDKTKIIVTNLRGKQFYMVYGFSMPNVEFFSLQ